MDTIPPGSKSPTVGLGHLNRPAPAPSSNGRVFFLPRPAIDFTGSRGGEGPGGGSRPPGFAARRRAIPHVLSPPAAAAGRGGAILQVPEKLSLLRGAARLPRTSPSG